MEKKKTRKRCRSEREPNRHEYGEINSVVDTAIKQNWRETSLVVQGLRLGAVTVVVQFSSVQSLSRVQLFVSP